MDNFYGGLADIIERDMEQPDRCVSEVDDYYIANQSTVKIIRETTQKGLSRATAALEKYKEDAAGEMTEEELEGIDVEAMRSQLDEFQTKVEGMKARREAGSQMPPGMARYAKTLATFTARYPQHGLKITMKGLRLMPGGAIKEE